VRPPRLATALVRLLVRQDLQESLLGDLEERWHLHCASAGRRAARRNYWRESLRGAIALARVSRPATARGARQPRKGDGLAMNVWQDVTYGARVLRKNPGYALGVVFTLALALGANTVIFSFANVLLIRPLPFGDTEQLAWIYTLDPQRGTDRSSASYPDYVAWRDGLESVSVLGAFRRDSAALTGRGEPARLVAFRTTANIVEIWKLQPVAGRLYRADEDRPGAPCVVALAHRFWQRHFNGAHGAIGGAITVDGRSCTVIGVVSPAVEIGNMSEIDVWLPLAADVTRTRRDERVYRVVGIRAPGATVEQVGAEARAISERLQREYPATNAGWSSRAATTREAITGPDTWITLALLGAVVLFVLVIACANVANLMLARASGRRGELAVRTALGASRARVVRQLLIEGLLLGALGGVAGLALGGASLQLIRAVAFEPFFELITIDRNVILFAALLSFLAPLIFSVLPALHATGPGAGDALKQASARTIGGAARRSRHALVVAQVALSIMLLVVAGLILRTMIAITRADLRLNPATLLTVYVELPERSYPDAGVTPFYEAVLRRIGALPGIRSAAVGSSLPVLENAPPARFAIEGQAAATADERPWAARVSVTSEYFAAVGLPLIGGRTFALTDTRDSGAVAVVNAEAARRYWTTSERAIGARVSLAPAGAPPQWVRIVGVVGNVENADLQRAPDPHLYLPMIQAPERDVGILVRTAQPGAIADGVRAAVRAEDPQLPLSQLRTVERALEEDRSSGRILTAMFAAFGVVALLLACTGLYGVVAFSVGQREQEIGVRLALGAVPRQITRLVFSQAARLVTIGVAIGVLGAAALARAAESVLYGVTSLDPITYAVVLATMVVCATVAAWVPARRATRLDPVRTLRG
jgi:predicted permease